MKLREVIAKIDFFLKKMITTTEVEKSFRGILGEFRLEQYVDIKKKDKFYKPPQTRRQISVFLRHSSPPKDFFRLCDLLAKHVPRVWNRDPKFVVMNMMMGYQSDDIIYDQLLNLRKLSWEKEKQDTHFRDKLHADMYYDYITQSIEKDFMIGSYLDIGCGDCRKTKLLGEKLGLSKENIFGVDIEGWGHYEKTEREKIGINFGTVKEGEKLKFKDEMFNIVSVFMVLHHVKDLNLFLSEINRVLKKGGYLVIREHDVVDGKDRMLCEIEHLLYDRTYPDRLTKEYMYAKYYDMFEWDIILERHGFRVRDVGYDSNTVKQEITPTRYYHGIYQKI